MTNLDHTSENPIARPLLPAFFAGLRCKCPQCHQGRLYSGFLKIKTQCQECGEPLHHHRADDMPAYLVIFIVGHLAVGLYMLVDRAFALLWWEHLLIWAPFVALASVLMLPFVKGAVVGLQWALRMHGFGGDNDHPNMR